MQVENLTDKQKKVSCRQRDEYLFRVNNFEDLLDISLKSLKGEYPLLSCVYEHFITDNSKIDLESLIDTNTFELNKVGKLIYQINQKGLLTLCSQSGKAINPDCTQRAYLIGIIDTETAHLLHQILNRIDSIFVTVTKNEIKSFSHSIWGIPVTYNSVNDDNNFPIPRTHIHFHPEYGCLEDYLNEDFKQQLEEDYSTISIIDGKYNRNAYGKGGLFVNILNALEKIKY